jgi:high-affinity iron transporter
MAASFLLALREGLEAALIVGIVLGALRKLGRRELGKWVWSGVLTASTMSLLGAMLLQAVGAKLEGRLEEIYEGTAMLAAAGLLTWMILWMQKQARMLKDRLETGVNQAVLAGGSWALFSLAFLAVGREGLELVLFLTASTFANGSALTTLGVVLGLGTAILFGSLMYTSTVRLDLRRFFQVTGILLLLFAAGLVAQGVHEFNEAGLIPSLVDHLWDVNPLLDEDSTTGMILKGLFGYHGNPSLSEVLAYILYLGGMATVWVRLSEKRTTGSQE